VREIVRGTAPENGVAPIRKAELTLDSLRLLLLAIRGYDVGARRDRAMLLLGFAAARRRWMSKRSYRRYLRRLREAGLILDTERGVGVRYLCFDATLAPIIGVPMQRGCAGESGSDRKR
jgi:hypothetical protein